MSVEGQFVDVKGPLVLSQSLGRGGEGEVFGVSGREGVAVKIYKPALRASRKRKIERMIELGLSSKAPFAAFPVSTVTDKSGQFVGFTMPVVKDHLPVFEVFGPGSRKKALPSWDYRHLIRTAINLSSAIGVVHDTGCVVGDINSKGILVGKNATVALIDTDSFQIAPDVPEYLCQVGVPEYTPPELQGRSLSSIPRNAQHDCFGLATIVFQLLFIGRHPFQGTHERTAKDLDVAIRESLFVYSRKRDTGMLRPPAMQMVDTVPDEIFDLFDRAFAPSSNGSRPPPDEWVRALTSLEARLEKCGRSKTHRAVGAATNCVWCALEQDHLLDLFPASLAELEGQLGSAGDEADVRELDRLWNQIASIPNEQLLKIEPKRTAVLAQPSAAALKAASPINKVNAWAVGLVLGAGCLLAVAPAAWLLWIVLGLIGLGNLKKAQQSSGHFTSIYVQVHSELQETLRRWREHIGLMRLVTLKADAWELKERVRAAADDLQARIEHFESTAAARHRQAYLSAFYIRNAKIDKITSANVAALISFGIETAADIEEWRVVAVSGIGPVKAAALVKWRDDKARRISKQAVVATDEDQRALAKLKYDHMLETRRLAATAVTKCRQILQLNNSILVAAASDNAVVSAARSRLAQAEQDLRHLGLSVPALPEHKVEPPKQPRPHKPSTFHAPPQANQGVPSKSKSRKSRKSPAAPLPPDCPQCGSSMVLRRARRGRGAGRQFWGCRDFPRCRGSRNY